MEKIKYRILNEYKPAISDRTVMIIGVTRSGTTLLGKIISTFKDIEYEFEPTLIQFLPILQGAGLLESDIAEELIQANLDEIFINHILGRYVNFRSTDDSRIEIAKNIQEIKFRWTKLKNRSEAYDYILEHDSTLVFKQVNLYRYLDLFYSAISNLKIINVIRDPFDTALSIEKKKWYSHEYLENSPSQLFKKEIKFSNKKYYIPWWVRSDDLERFISYSEFDRCLLCWNTLISDFFNIRPKLKLNSNNYIEIKYEDLTSVINREKIVERIGNFVKKEQTDKTKKMIEKINKKKEKKYPEFDKNEFNKANKIYNNFVK